MRVQVIIVGGVQALLHALGLWPLWCRAGRWRGKRPPGPLGWLALLLLLLPQLLQACAR